MAEEHDLSFGKVAISKGYCSKQQLMEALETLEQVRGLGLNEQIGSILIKKKVMSEEQVREVLRAQAQKSKIKIANYEILEKVGQGGMGSVFKARQIAMDRIVALKILAPKLAEDRSFCERFIKEARAVAKLNHPNIIVGIDVGRHGKYYYFAMEFVDGETALTRLREKKTFTEAEALRIAAQIASALEHAHKHGLIHRDIKPDNIMLPTRGEAKLCDLGLAKKISTDASGTSTGAAVGTPHYIAPEQARGLDNVGITADIYALGGTLYHMTTGQTLFKGENSTVIMTQHLSAEAPNARNLAPELSEHFCRLLEKMLAKDPADRHASPTELREDLERVAAGASMKAPLPPNSSSSMERTPRESVKRKNRTTGPQPPVRAAAGPRRGGERITTGPRAPIDRPDQPTGPKPSVKANRILVFAAAAIALGVVVGLGVASNGPETQTSSAPPKSGPEEPADPVNADDLTQTSATSPSSEAAKTANVATPASVPFAPPGGDAGHAPWDAARKAWRETPEDLAAILGLYKAAEKGLAPTRVGELRHERGRILQALQDQFQPILDGRLREARVKAQNNDLPGALEMLDAGGFPKRLLAPETQALLTEARKEFQPPASAAIAVLRKELQQAGAQTKVLNALNDKVNQLIGQHKGDAKAFAELNELKGQLSEQLKKAQETHQDRREESFETAVNRAHELSKKGDLAGAHKVLEALAGAKLSKDQLDLANRLRDDVKDALDHFQRARQILEGMAGKTENAKVTDRSGHSVRSPVLRAVSDKNGPAVVLKERGKEVVIPLLDVEAECLLGFAGVRKANPQGRLALGAYDWWLGHYAAAYPFLEEIDAAKFRRDAAYYMDRMDREAGELMDQILALYSQAQDAKLPKMLREERQKQAAPLLERLKRDYATTRTYRERSKD
ncbi:MAG: protein kinase [Planctomycetota bacterium]|nr:protein kinase [Planctomycetota bacterium]